MISLSEHDWDHWEPFSAPVDDALQLEFSMLSPFYRMDLIPLRYTKTATIYGVSFTLPDQHGIFNFMVDYKRPFMTYLEEKRTVSVRHFAHDEFPRSYAISGAWPWIAGIFATVLGFVAFCLVWLYSAPTDFPESKKKL